MKLKISLLAALCALGLALLLWPGDNIYFKEVKGPDKNISFALNDFVISWLASQQKLEITNRGKVKWASAPFTSFIGAGNGTEAVEEHKGSFFIDENTEFRCLQQEVSSLTRQKNLIVLQGNLNCDRLIAYTLNFSITEEGFLSAQLSFADADVNRSYLHYSIDNNESIFGFDIILCL